MKLFYFNKLLQTKKLKKKKDIQFYIYQNFLIIMFLLTHYKAKLIN